MKTRTPTRATLDRQDRAARKAERDEAARRRALQAATDSEGTLHFYMLRVETRHFDFRVFGRTPDECRALMRAAWLKHAGETGADPDFFDEQVVEDEWYCEPITVPSAMRDDHVLVTRP